jgi:hypothetical protein
VGAGVPQVEAVRDGSKPNGPTDDSAALAGAYPPPVLIIRIEAGYAVTT